MNHQQSAAVLVAIALALLVYVLCRMCKDNKKANLEDKAKEETKKPEPEHVIPFKLVEDRVARQMLYDAVERGEKTITLTPFLDENGKVYDPNPEAKTWSDHPLGIAVLNRDIIESAHRFAQDSKEDSPYFNLSPGDVKYREFFPALPSEWLDNINPPTIFAKPGIAAQRLGNHFAKHDKMVSLKLDGGGFYLDILRFSIALDEGRVIFKSEHYNPRRPAAIAYKYWHPGDQGYLFKKSDLLSADIGPGTVSHDYMEMDVLTPDIIKQLKEHIGDQVVTHARVYRTFRHMNVEIHYGDKDDMVIISDVKAFDHILEYNPRKSNTTIVDQLLNRYPAAKPGINVVDFADRKATWVKCNGAWTNGLN